MSVHCPRCGGRIFQLSYGADNRGCLACGWYDYPVADLPVPSVQRVCRVCRVCRREKPLAEYDVDRQGYRRRVCGACRGAGETVQQGRDEQGRFAEVEKEGSDATEVR